MSEVLKLSRPVVKARPYILHFPATGTEYPVSSEEAQRLIDNYPALTGSSVNRVYLRADDGQACSLYPATMDGAPAFSFEPVAAP